MRRIQPSFTLLAATGVIGLATIAQAAPAGDNSSNQGKQPQQAAQQSGEKQSRKTPQGFVLVDEQVITLTANEPQNHFLRAHEYLAANDPRAAAAEVRIAAAYLDMQASRKGNADQQDLRSTSNDLRQLADRIAKGSEQQEKTEENAGEKASGHAQTAEQKELSQAFAHADLVLAKHFQEEASNEINRHKPIMAGHDLDAATAAFTAGCTWSGEKCSKDAAQAVADARRISDEMLSPTPNGQAENASNKPQENKTQNQAQGPESNGEAQPAAARISANQSTVETNRVPDDASKAVDELGKAINEACSQNKSGQTNAGSEKPAQNNNEPAKTPAK